MVGTFPSFWPRRSQHEGEEAWPGSVGSPHMARGSCRSARPRVLGDTFGEWGGECWPGGKRADDSKFVGGVGLHAADLGDYCDSAAEALPEDFGWTCRGRGSS